MSKYKWSMQDGRPKIEMMPLEVSFKMNEKKYSVDFHKKKVYILA